jgi:hypothetical protein
LALGNFADYLLELLKQLEKFVVYSEGTLYSSISLLKIGGVDRRTLPFICPHDQNRFGS